MSASLSCLVSGVWCLAAIHGAEAAVNNTLLIGFTIYTRGTSTFKNLPVLIIILACLSMLCPCSFILPFPLPPPLLSSPSLPHFLLPTPSPSLLPSLPPSFSHSLSLTPSLPPSPPGFVLFVGVLFPAAAMALWTFLECCYEDDEEEERENRSDQL